MIQVVQVLARLRWAWRSTRVCALCRTRLALWRRYQGRYYCLACAGLHRRVVRHHSQRLWTLAAHGAIQAGERGPAFRRFVCYFVRGWVPPKGPTNAR